MDEPEDAVGRRMIAADGSTLIFLEGADYGGYGGDSWWLRRNAPDGNFCIEQMGGVAWGGTWNNLYAWEEGLAKLSPEGRAKAMLEREKLDGREEKL